MTIGIAASGPGAGRAILAGLATVETVGRGAIGGFVSFAVIAGGAVHRAETQVGGSAALFSGEAMPDLFGRATIAALMSSGPNRPAPLSQFTPADPAVGILTGHRFPNAAGCGGIPLNLEVLDRMRAGEGARAAVEAVVAENPEADAGIIAVAADGTLHAADTRYLSEFGDAGAALVEDGAHGVRIAVLHNAILPHSGLAALAAEVVRDSMIGDGRISSHVRVTAGIAIEPGPFRGLHVDEHDRVVRITLPPGHIRRERWSFGLGYRVRVLRAGERIGRVLYEPYMVAERGRLVSVDGAAALDIPVQRDFRA
jgi:hypothetical protein